MADLIQLDSPQANLNRARFLGRDFFTFVDDIVARIQALFVTEFNDFVSSGTGQMLIDYTAWAAETLSFYIDRGAAESYLSTASLRRSVNRLARQIGYKMGAAVGASVDLSVNLDNIYSFDVPIEVGFQFKGPNNLVFEAIEDVTFPAGEGPTSPSRTIACVQGQTVVHQFVSNGSRNQSFRMSPPGDLTPADGSFEVTVEASVWTESDFITFDKTNQYEVDYNSDPPLVRFGDGVAGNIPPTGASIQVTYVATAGRDGLVLQGTIVDVVSPLVVAFETISLTITNASRSSGGDDRESLESAKANAPLYFKARDVAVTHEDYVGLSQSYRDPVAGAVAVAQAFVARSAANDVTLLTLLDNIRAIISPMATNVQAETVSATAFLNTATTSYTSANTELTTVNAKFDTIVTNPTETIATGLAIDIRDASELIRANSNDIASQVTDGKALVNGLTTAGTDQLTTTTRDAIVAYFDGIDTRSSTIKTQANAQITSVGSIESAVKVAKVSTGTMSTELTTISSSLASALVDMGDIDAIVTAQFDTAVETELTAIYDHVDTMLAEDCKANLVQVPILAYDIDGFFAAPSVALMRSLETYLNERKEITQTVEVVSGASLLVAAEITATIGVLTGYVHATILSNVTKKIDSLLKGRAFGQSLRISDLASSVVPDPQTGTGGIEGVKYAIFDIYEPIAKIDADGNLIILEQEVVTKGLLTLYAEIAED